MWVIELYNRERISYLTKHGPGSIMLAVVLKSKEHCKRLSRVYSRFKYLSGQFVEIEPDMECYEYLKSKGNNERDRYR